MRDACVWREKEGFYREAAGLDYRGECRAHVNDMTQSLENLMAHPHLLRPIDTMMFKQTTLVSRFYIISTVVKGHTMPQQQVRSHFR